MNEYDVVVIDGGAAGLSAALVLSRARRMVAVVDAGSPRNAPASHMHGFLPTVWPWEDAWTTLFTVLRAPPPQGATT